MHESHDLLMPATTDIRQLNERATSQLADMVRRQYEEGHDGAEIDAVRYVLLVILF